MDADRHDRHLRNLRRWRDGDEPDLTLGFVAEHVRKTVGRPHKQLGQLTKIWADHVPAHLAEHTALRSLSRGVLTVTVSDSAALYELDRLLRAGLERTLRSSAPTTLRRVKLTVGDLDA